MQSEPNRDQEQAIQDKVFARVQGEVEKLAATVDCTNQVIFVVDSSFGDAPPEEMPPGSPPLVLVESRQKVADMLSGSLDQSLHTAMLGAPPWAVLVVIAAGESVAIRLIHRYQMTTKEHFKENPFASGEYECTPTGILLVIFHTDLADVREGFARDRMRRFQERAKGLLAAEQFKPSPRPLDVFLFEEFGGLAIQAAVNAGDNQLASEIPFRYAPVLS